MVVVDTFDFFVLEIGLLKKGKNRLVDQIPIMPKNVLCLRLFQYKKSKQVKKSNFRIVLCHF